MWEREQLSLKRHLSDISFNIQELRVMLDELYMNEEFENDNKWAYERVINSLDKLFVIRKDFEKLTEKVEENDV
jgi:ligand-binding sensor protein